MITNEKISAAKLAATTHADRLDSLAGHIERDLLPLITKNDGKTITRRLFAPMCEAVGLTPKESRFSGVYCDGADWKADVLGHTHGAPEHYYISGVRVRTSPLGSFYDLPLIPSASGKLDAAKTCARLQEIAGDARKYARRERWTAERMEDAAAEFNRIQAAAQKLLDDLDAAGKAFDPKYPGSASISVFCELDRDAYRSISDLKWHN